MIVPKPPVKDLCKTCALVSPWLERKDFAVVSPTGVAHTGLSDGTTACGKDATGAAWWWPA